MRSHFVLHVLLFLVTVAQAAGQQDPKREQIQDQVDQFPEVTVEFDPKTQNAVKVTAYGKRAGDALLLQVAKAPTVQHLFLYPETESQITDQGVSPLSSLKIRSLILDSTNLTDRGIQTIGGLTTLEFLQIGGRKITEVGFAHLTNLTNLEYLSLRNTRVNDAALEKLLPSFPNLKTLDLYATPVTNTGIAQARMNGLLNVLRVDATNSNADLFEALHTPLNPDLSGLTMPGMQDLQTLLINRNTKLSHNQVFHLAQLIGQTQLTELRIRGSNPGLTIADTNDARELTNAANLASVLAAKGAYLEFEDQDGRFVPSTVAFLRNSGVFSSGVLASIPTTVRRVSLYGQSTVDGESIAPLAYLKDLTVLNLSGTSVGSAPKDIWYLANIIGLTDLASPAGEVLTPDTTPVDSTELNRAMQTAKSLREMGAYAYFSAVPIPGKTNVRLQLSGVDFHERLLVDGHNYFSPPATVAEAKRDLGTFAYELVALDVDPAQVIQIGICNSVVTTLDGKENFPGWTATAKTVDGKMIISSPYDGWVADFTKRPTTPTTAPTATVNSTLFQVTTN